MRRKFRIGCIFLIMVTMWFQASYTTMAITMDEEELEDDLEYSELNNDQIDEVDSSGKFRTNARCAIALDGKTKEVLYEQNGFEVVAMASTTKIMTALVAINQGDLEREITISKNAAGIRGSTVGYRAGEKIKLRELIVGLMFKSGNDAAIAIAEGLAGDINNFCNMMNDYAISIGVVDTHFESPHGLDSAKHYSSAYDLALLTSVAMKNKFFREVVGSREMPKSKYNFTRDYNNINKILWKIPGANGVKTGYTGQAGKCLVSSVEDSGRDIIIVVLNCTDRWNQTEKIFKHVVSTHSFEEDDGSTTLSHLGGLGTIFGEEQFQYGYSQKRGRDMDI